MIPCQPSSPSWYTSSLGSHSWRPVSKLVATNAGVKAFTRGPRPPNPCIAMPKSPSLS